MADNLPFGEIRPQARPLGSFIQPVQQQVAQTARFSQLSNPQTITTLQQGNGGSVQGYNQWQQIATALAPFSEQLVKLTQTGVFSYVENQIQKGYYEQLKNQQVKATQTFQMQQEAGAAQAADMTGQLAKRDPQAAQLLQDSNPFRLVGRRRAAAQLAGENVDSILTADFITNRGELAGLQPGSPQLMQRKQQLTQQVMNKYGLSGDEPEAVFYTVPKLNQAWDKYATKQAEAFGRAVDDSATGLSIAAVGAKLQGFAQNGIPFGGEVIKMGDSRFAQLAGNLLTDEIDKSLSMVSDRGAVVRELQKQLYGTYGQVPGLRDALTYIKGGRPGDAQRPVWGASNPLDALELTNRGNKARLEGYENQQKGLEQQLDGLWWEQGMPGSMVPSDPRYASALLTFRNKAAQAGFRDVDSYMKGRMDSQSAVTGEIYAPSPIEQQAAVDQINDISITDLRQPGAVNRLRQRINQVAAAQPTRALQEAKLKELRGILDERIKQAEAFTPGVQKDIDRALQQDLKAGPIQGMIDKGGGNSAFLAALQGGQGVVGAAGTADAKVGAFASRVQDLYVRAFEAKLGDWQSKNPGQPLTPATKNILLNQAVMEVRKGTEYQRAYEEVTGRKPGEVGTKKVGDGKVGNDPGPAVRGVPQAAAKSLPDTTVQRYRQQPVMEGKWLRQELVNVGAGKPASADLYRLANRAGTTTSRYLLEQLRFYPQLDPNGEIRNHLQREVTQQRQGQRVSAANYSAVVGETAFNPMAPGSWLMNMLVPPAAAATMPAGYERFTGGRVTSVVGDRGGLAATVSAGEGGWESVNYGTTGSASRMPLTTLTIAQVERMQSAGKVFAVGAYQFTPGVLARARRDAGLSGNELMTPEVQTKLFWGLAMGGKRSRLASYLRGESNDLTGAHQDLSMEWAGVAGPSGRGYYDGDSAGNRASVGAARVRQALIRARRELSGGR